MMLINITFAKPPKSDVEQVMKVATGFGFVMAVVPKELGDRLASSALTGALCKKMAEFASEAKKPGTSTTASTPC